MTQREFNEKYKQWIPAGWGGLEFEVSEVIEYLDLVMQDMTLIPGFELHQIKMKFDWPRFYFTTDFKCKALESAITVKVQEQISEVLKGRDLSKERWSRIMNKQQEGSTAVVEETWMELEYYDEYQKALTTGMFFEWFPNLTGEWSKDKYWFCHEMRKIKRSNDKEIKG